MRHTAGSDRRRDRTPPSGNHNIDHAPETPEIRPVEGQQLALAIGQHRRNDMCVIHLPATEGEATGEAAKLTPDVRPILPHREAFSE